MQKKNAKRLWHWTGIQFFRSINGFPIVAHVDFEWDHKSVKFAAQINPIQLEKARLDEIAQTFHKNNIELGIREVAKLYPYQRHHLDSIKSLEVELFEFTDQLKRYGFTGSTAGHNTMYAQ